MAAERCGYTPTVRGGRDLGRASCWRETYRDSDRCIWHAADDKSVVELARSKPMAGERLDGAALGGLDLSDVDWLADAVLVGVDFTNADVSGADFGDTDLRKTSFTDAEAVGTNFRGANLESANVDDTDLRGADLTMARFADTNITESQINRKTRFGESIVYEAEMRDLPDYDSRENALETATQTYRKLEELSVANSLNAQAGRQYRKAKDIRRQFNWRADNYFDAITAEASRLFTGYGNRPWRVIFTSLGVILSAALVYPLIGGLRRTSEPEAVYTIADLSQQSLGHLATVLLRSVFFSVVTFTTLGYGNLEPSTTVGRYLAGLEALLGSILMALLVAVLTRSTWLR